MQYVCDLPSDKIVSTDRTIDNTNAKHLELYCIMAEYNNAGFPLSYCLLSTASTINQRKRLEALVAWGICLQDQYGINLIFMHVNKDLAEIGCSKKVWNAKISLCWWHLWCTVCTRLVKAKLSMTPYNIEHACTKFEFIDPNFFLPGTKINIEDYERGLPEDAVLPSVVDRTPAASMVPPTKALIDTGNTLQTQVAIPLRNTATTLHIKLPLST
jgi:hypothetical protein